MRTRRIANPKIKDDEIEIACRFEINKRKDIEKEETKIKKEQEINLLYMIGDY